MKINKILSITYGIIAIMVFIINIMQPLDRWVVGTWILMAGFFGVIGFWD